MILVYFPAIGGVVIWFFMQLHCTAKGWKFEFWLLVSVMCKKHLVNMQINIFLGLLVSEDGGILLLRNIGNYYHLTQNNSPEDLNCHQHLYEGFRSCIQVVVMFFWAVSQLSLQRFSWKFLSWALHTFTTDDVSLILTGQYIRALHLKSS